MKTQIFKKITAAMLAATMAVTFASASVSAHTSENIDSLSYDETEYVDITEYFTDLEFSTPTLYSDYENFGASPRSTSAIPEKYWGAYNAADGVSYLQINGAQKVTFKGKYPGGFLFCQYNNVTDLYFNPTATNSDNFTVNYSQYHSLTLNSD